MALNYYRLLGVPPDAGQRRIKAAYRSLAKRFHPDRNSDSETATELFRQVSDAYRVLSNSQLRAQYDKTLNEQKEGTATTKSNHSDPQHKFNHFVKSLLDSLFGTLDQQTEPSVKKPIRKPKNTAKKVEKPAFNFHYNLAMEKNKTPYTRGEDGVFRKTPR